ncbi:DUF4390 domain-containing protein [Candidatus Woesebacteria bacterium]|nr:MAG: DUF4390 domain-containing protein [Candidatus Woesebacteria bacterium]
MTLLRNRKICILLLGILFFVQNPAFAQDAELTNIIVTNTRDDLLVYLNVEGAFREKMRKAILSGVPTTFSFFVTIYRVRNLWLDKKVADIKTTNTIKYNNLKEEFVVKRSWDGGGLHVTQSFKEARKLMAEIDSLKVIPLSMLEKGRHYQIRAKAELNKITLPYYLHYVFFFVSLWDFETDLYTIDFIY